MVVQVILAAVGISMEAWKRLTPEQKKAVTTQFEKGKVGMAKIFAKRFVKARKTSKTTRKKRKTQRRRR